MSGDVLEIRDCPAGCPLFLERPLRGGENSEAHTVLSGDLAPRGASSGQGDPGAFVTFEEAQKGNRSALLVYVSQAYFHICLSFWKNNACLHFVP